MNIQEATKLAMAQGTAIKRESDPGKNGILPTNLSSYQCMVVHDVYQKDQKAYARWQPSADDLLANDWELLI
ncbi:Thoeris anti-defense Tad2 family protein [Staphylococcus nepalensis]|uniref:Thoeris anti-defense Tad2 family protein n=1 Tax=Staphylococcus nepalensis TaxID=214473 RepID=UPI00301A45D9